MVEVAVSGGDALSKVRTIVIVGKTGNGKSATRNSILGYKAFESRLSSSGVTVTCELHSGVSKSGQPINIIDTPGPFDFAEGGTEVIANEIVKCIDLAGFAGIDAIVFVLSLRTRFSQQEEATFRSLNVLFGPRMVDYTIVVFTGGDELEDIDFEEYITQPDVPQPLKEIIRLCENRVVLFDNKTKDQLVRLNQSDKFWCLLNVVVARNRGEPYKEKLAAGALVAAASEKRSAETEQEHTERLKLIADMVEGKLSDIKSEMENQFLEERLARDEAERLAAESRRIAEAETLRLRVAIEAARREDFLKHETDMQKERVKRLEAETKAREDVLKAEREARILMESIDWAERRANDIRAQLVRTCAIL